MLEDDDTTSWHVHDEVSSLTKINNSCQIKIRGILILNLSDKRKQEEFRNRAYVALRLEASRSRNSGDDDGIVVIDHSKLDRIFDLIYTKEIQNYQQYYRRWLCQYLNSTRAWPVSFREIQITGRPTAAGAAPAGLHGLPHEQRMVWMQASPQVTEENISTGKELQLES
jgi:hypothetical protein